MVTAIIVAGGQGTRMQGEQRKQYLSLAGLPILTRTLMVFDKCDPVKQIILVIPQDDMDYCRKDILERAGLSRQIRLTPGGGSRQESVFNGLKEVGEHSDIVVIHDGVRPFVENAQLIACIDGARESGACIIGVPAHETLKQIGSSGQILRTLKRDDVWMAQTPQAFQHDLIRKAHADARAEGFCATHDACLVEKMGATVKILKGSRTNIKITTSEDLEMARTIMSKFE